MRKNKKIIVLVLACIYTFFLCSCKSESEPDELFILTSSNGADMDRESFKSFSKNASDYGLYTDWKVKENDDADRVKKISQKGGEEYQYKTTQAYMMNSTSGEYGRFYDTYVKREKDSSGRDNILDECTYLRGTEFMCNYFSFEENIGIYKGVGDSRTIAETFLTELMSAETFEEYTHTETREEVFPGETLYRYERFIEGYKTNDEITIYVNQDGMVVAYYIWEYGKFDDVKEELKKEQLDATKEKLEAEIAKAFDGVEIELGEPCIIVNMSGEAYLEIPIIEKTCAYTMITPIE